jgi:hypothetical protein
MGFSGDLKTAIKINGSRKKGDKISGEIEKYDNNGKCYLKKASFRKYKFLPKGCKVAKRICIVCLKNEIHKNDNNYESKICKACAKN